VDRREVGEALELALAVARGAVEPVAETFDGDAPLGGRRLVALRRWWCHISAGAGEQE
jgi:hypothetical protein